VTGKQLGLRLALGLIGALSMSNSLAPAAEVPNWYVRGVAAALLDPGIPTQVLDLPRAKDALGALAKSNVPRAAQKRIAHRLLDELRGTNDENRIAAEKALGAFHPDDWEELGETVEALVKLTRVDSPDLQETAAYALGRIQSDSPHQRNAALDPLIDLTTSHYVSVQAAAATVLGSLYCCDRP
jgi:HEAT repeat protein